LSASAELLVCTETREKLSPCILWRVQVVGAGISVDRMGCCTKATVCPDEVQKGKVLSWTGNMAFFLFLFIVVYTSKYTFSLYIDYILHDFK